MKTPLAYLRRGLYLIGSPLGFWPVAIFIMFAYGANGRATDGLGPVVLWGLFCGAANVLRRLLFANRSFARTKVPEERPMPPPKLAVSVAPVIDEGACLDQQAMVDRLPDHLRALIRRA